jgi:hypothetical protein
MKKIAFALFTIMIVVSCAKSVSNSSAPPTPKLDSAVEPKGSIVGKWLEYESYVNPGPVGAGWQKVDSVVNPNYTEFKADSTIVNTPDSFSTAVRYELITDSTMNLYTKDSTKIFFRYSATINHLVLYPPCSEGCGLRFIRVE